MVGKGGVVSMPPYVKGIVDMDMKHVIRKEITLFLTLCCMFIPATAFSYAYASSVKSSEISVQNVYINMDNKTDNNMHINIFGDKKIIEPGSHNEVTVNIINTSTSDLEGNLQFQAKNDYGIPLKFYISVADKGTEKSLLGTSGDMKPLDSPVSDNITIAKNKKVVCKIKWEWPFENGRDIEDSSLGKQAVISAVDYTFKSKLAVSESVGENKEHGLKAVENIQVENSVKKDKSNTKEKTGPSFLGKLSSAVQTGDNWNNPIFYIFGGITLWILIILLKRRKEKDENEKQI